MERASQTMEPEQSQTPATAETAVARPAQPEPAPPVQKKSRAKLFIMVILLLMVAGAGGFVWWLWAQGHEETDDSYIDGHITTISSRVQGTVTKVFVDDNQQVNTNQPLVQLDPRDLQTRVDQLNASLKQTLQQSGASHAKIGQSALSGAGQTTTANGETKSALAELDRAKAALLAAIDEQRQTEAKVTEEQAQLEYSRTDFERYKLVYEQRAVTKQQYDRAKENITVAQAQLEGAMHARQEAKRKVLEAEANIRDAEAHQLRSQGQVQSAQASQQQEDIDKQNYQSQVSSADMVKSQLEEAKLQLSYTSINAPVAGKVGRKSVEVGQRVQVGQALMAVVQNDYWVTANFKETQLNKMRIGQEAEIKIDSFPGKVFKGKVDSLSPASGAKFSVLPPDNATGNFTKVVQRVPVKIVLDSKSLGDYASRLAPGMSCVSEVKFK